MRFSRILLIIPEYPANVLGPSSPFAGIGYLAESLEKNNIEYDVIDMRLKHNNLKTLLNKIRYFKPGLIGLHLMTFNYLNHYKIIKTIKQEFPDVCIVVGGPHLSMLREKVLMECPEIDFGIVLESENSTIELAEGRDLKSIRGLIYRNNDIVYNGDREFIKDLDILPFPKYKRFELDKYVTRQIGLVTSRGCPYKCIYCAVNLCIGREYRKRSPKSVVDEIEYWYNEGYSEFNILDDNFSIDKKRVYEICDEIKRRHIKGLNFACPNGLRVTNVDRDLLKRMKDVGFNKIFFGVEGGTNKVLTALRKGVDIETVEQVVKHACELEYEVGLFFLLGSPQETMSDVEASLKLASKYPIIDAVFNNLIPYPNTELFEWVEENRYFIKAPAEYLNSVSHFNSQPVFATPEFTLKERMATRKRIEKVRKVIRKKYIKRLLPAWFPFKAVVSCVYVSGWFQNISQNNRIFRQIVEGLRRLLSQYAHRV